MLPSALPKTLVKELAAHRRAASEGPRIRLDFFASNTTPGLEVARSVGRMLFIPDAARQNAFAIIVGARVSLSFLTEDSDDDTQLVLGKLIAAMAILLVYSGL